MPFSPKLGKTSSQKKFAQARAASAATRRDVAFASRHNVKKGIKFPTLHAPPGMQNPNAVVQSVGNRFDFRSLARFAAQTFAHTMGVSLTPRQTKRLHGKLFEEHKIKHGNSFIRHTSSAAAMQKELPKLLAAMSLKDAERYVSLVEEAFDTGGWGTWAPNTPSTVKTKKHAHQLMGIIEGRKGPHLRDMVMIDPDHGPGVSAYRVGWPNFPHPHAKWKDGTPMTYRELQLLHEFGDHLFGGVKFPPRPIFQLIEDLWGKDLRDNRRKTIMQHVQTFDIPERLR